jgi:hypothetical protein
MQRTAVVNIDDRRFLQPLFALSYPVDNRVTVETPSSKAS